MEKKPMMMRIARAVLTACLCLTAVTLSGCEDDPTDGLHRKGQGTQAPGSTAPDAGTP